MTKNEFKEITDKLLKDCTKIRNIKSEIYATGGDRLSNFKSAAGLQRTIPERALFGMMSKHLVGLSDFVDCLENNFVVNKEEWDEKIMDSINYLILLYALLKEREQV